MYGKIKWQHQDKQPGTVKRSSSLRAAIHNTPHFLYPLKSSPGKCVFSFYFMMSFIYSGSLWIIESRFACQEMQEHFI